MSIYFLKGFPADLGECSEELRQNLAAALEPSLLRLDDTPFAELPERRLEEARELVREIEVDASHFRDSDLSSDVGAYMSWPTVLITGEIDDETIRHYAALEVKVQASWLAAFSLAKTAGELIQKLDRDKMSLRKVESIGWELTGLESDVGASIDASVSSRYRQALDTMIETSGLRREWGRARQRLAEVRAYASFRTSDRNYRFQQAIELLLLIAAVATVTPVFVSIPLQSVDDVTSQLAPLASIATVLLVGTLFVLLRRR